MLYFIVMLWHKSLQQLRWGLFRHHPDSDDFFFVLIRIFTFQELKAKRMYIAIAWSDHGLALCKVHGSGTFSIHG
jgi:hypothetical protein